MKRYKNPAKIIIVAFVICYLTIVGGWFIGETVFNFIEIGGVSGN